MPSNLADVERADSMAAKEWSGRIRVAAWGSEITKSIVRNYPKEKPVKTRFV
jgi:hypothetical protein